MTNAVIWDISRCGSCKNRRFGGTYRLHHQGDKNGLTRNTVSGNYQPTHATKKYYVRREELVWNIRLRMDREVRVAGNGVGLLIGQTIKRNSTASEEREKWFRVNRGRLWIGGRVAKWTWVMP
jgi:hypothetical protein